MVKIKALVRQRYEGVTYGEGEEFEVSDQDAADLCAMKFAVRCDPAKLPALVRAKRTYNRRDLTAQ